MKGDPGRRRISALKAASLIAADGLTAKSKLRERIKSIDFAGAPKKSIT
jgi:hypothetical protein